MIKKYTRHVISKIVEHETREFLTIEDDITITEDSRLVDLGAEETDTAGIIMVIERELDIRDSGITKAETIRDLVDGFYEVMKDKAMSGFHSHLENRP